MNIAWIHELWLKRSLMICIICKSWICPSGRISKGKQKKNPHHVFDVRRIFVADRTDELGPRSRCGKLAREKLARCWLDSVMVELLRQNSCDPWHLITTKTHTCHTCFGMKSYPHPSPRQKQTSAFSGCD